jgi:hypothetical protein
MWGGCRSQVILKYGIRSVLQATWSGLASAKRSGMASDNQLDLFRSADHLFQVPECTCCNVIVKGIKDVTAACSYIVNALGSALHLMGINFHFQKVALDCTVSQLCGPSLRELLCIILCVPICFRVNSTLQFYFDSDIGSVSQETSVLDDLTLSPTTFTQQKLRRCFGNETSSKSKPRGKST